MERPKEEDSKERKHREIADQRFATGRMNDQLPFSLQPKRYDVLISDFRAKARGRSRTPLAPPRETL